METGRFLLRATNTGISAVIDHKGRVLAASTQDRPEAIRSEIALFSGETPYARTGNLPVVAAAIALLALLSRRRGSRPARDD